MDSNDCSLRLGLAVFVASLHYFDYLNNHINCLICLLARLSVNVSLRVHFFPLPRRLRNEYNITLFSMTVGRRKLLLKKSVATRQTNINYE